MCKEEDEDGLHEMTIKDQLKTEDESHSSDVAEDDESAFISVKEEPIDGVSAENWSIDMTSDTSCSDVKEEPHCQETTVRDPLRAVTTVSHEGSGGGANRSVEGDSVVTKRLHKCPECGAGFYSLDQLDDHMENHWKEKPFVCNYCWKPFAQKNLLAQHKKIHTKERHFCEKCGKSFSGKTIDAHMRNHSGDKPFVCTYCGKKFAMKSYLSTHVKIHFQELKCKKCEKNFSNEARFNQHMHTHDKEEPYVCSHCGKSFSQTPYLAQHMRVHISK